MLLADYGTEKNAETKQSFREAIISCDLHSDLTTYDHFFATSFRDDMTSQLKELVINDRIRALCQI